MFPTSSAGSAPFCPGSPPPSSCRLRACSQHRAVPALCVTLALGGFGDRPERPTDHEGLRPPGQPAMSPALGRGRSEGQPAMSTALGFLLEINSPPPPLSRMLWPLPCTARGCGYLPTPASLAPSVNAGAGWSPQCHQLSKTQSTLHRVTAWTLAFLQRHPHRYLLGAQAPARLVELVAPPCWTPFPAVPLLPPPIDSVNTCSPGFLSPDFRQSRFCCIPSAPLTSVQVCLQPW